MIEMWDDIFAKLNPEIKEDISKGNVMNAFSKMHFILNAVWDECNRVLADNGFICINIGDATRTIQNDFRLFSNHSMVINYFSKAGYCVLPDIHWHKQSNAPNKFMGSGMYPAGAYVTYEHEYILIFRKGGKRIFKGNEKKTRQKSAFFWEERNAWFSDLWEIKGTTQILQNNGTTRKRNASFPFEVPYRLVNMYSSEGDTVLDPFCGIGTTNLACMTANRNSIGVEIDPEITKIAKANLLVSPYVLNKIIDSRIDAHLSFIKSLTEEKRCKCYINDIHRFAVKTRQEMEIHIEKLADILMVNDLIECHYQ